MQQCRHNAIIAVIDCFKYLPRCHTTGRRQATTTPSRCSSPMRAAGHTGTWQFPLQPLLSAARHLPGESSLAPPRFACATKSALRGEQTFVPLLQRWSPAPSLRKAASFAKCEHHVDREATLRSDILFALTPHVAASDVT